MFSADWSETLFINSAYEEIWGEPLAGIVEEPRTFLEGVHPADREDVIAAMEAISAGESRDLEFRVNPSEDYERWVSVHAEPATDERGEVVSVAGFTRDVTESKRRERALKQYREELERSNESLQEFAYIASHDLQEPLRMVSSYVDLLEQEYGDDLDGEAEEYMAFASEGARRMKEMINSLLEYSRVHSEAGDLAPVDANAVFADTEQDLELLIAEHGATVEVEDLPKVEADRDQLGQLFQNLVKNAIEHADEGANPRVEVTATERDGVVEFAVADNGPGIPEGREEDIFEIFTRGTSTSDADSTGIGLAVAKRIVRRHGGEIWAESDGEAGATFRFTIPAVDEDAETTTP
jgi:PAS domain S-box-containing protein